MININLYNYIIYHYSQSLYYVEQTDERKMSMGKKDDKVYTEQLHCRVTKKEKKLAKKLSERAGLTFSEYMRTCILCDMGLDEIPIGEILVRAEEVARYVEETYGTDDKLKGQVNALWELCSLK